MRKAIITTMLIVLCLAIPGGAQGDAPAVIPVYEGDSLIIRLDLSSLLTAERANRLEDGVALRCEVGVELRRPRRLWGSTIETSRYTSYVTSYSIGTKEFTVSHTSSDSTRHRNLKSMAALHRYFADSVIVVLLEESGFDLGSHYFLQVEVETIWLTSLNEAADGSAAAEDQSELEWMFEQFLQLAGYGREHLSFATDDFRLSDIRSE